MTVSWHYAFSVATLGNTQNTKLGLFGKLWNLLFGLTHFLHFLSSLTSSCAWCESLTVHVQASAYTSPSGILQNFL